MITDQLPVRMHQARGGKHDVLKVSGVSDSTNIPPTAPAPSIASITYTKELQLCSLTEKERTAWLLEPDHPADYGGTQ